MLPPSALSTAAYSLRQLFLNNIAGFEDVNQIRIGHPADNIKDLDDTGLNCLNLFFYEVHLDGYPADAGSENPVFVRLSCLVTAVGAVTPEPTEEDNASERNIGKGENELRLIGEVMRILHEQPLLTIGDEAGNAVASLQIVPFKFSLDSLNHVWSTQTDVSYRLSVAYEISLAPVPFRNAVESSPLVADPNLVIWGAMSRPQEREQEGMASLQPQVKFLRVDTDVPNWAPHICHKKNLDETTATLHYLSRIPGDLEDPLDIVIAGKPEGIVRLFWNVWVRKADNTVSGWQEALPDAAEPKAKTLAAATDNFSPATIDPTKIQDDSVFQVLLPADVRAEDTQAWQAVLFAVHEWEHQDPAGSGETVTTDIRSNMLMFYGGMA